MIVVKPKSLEELLGFIQGHKNILVIGCDGCTTPPRGLREAQMYTNLLELAAKVRGLEFNLKAMTLPKTCDSHLVYSGLENQISGVDAVISLACGIGVQVLNEVFPQIQTFPGNDTTFNGMQEKEGAVFEERCKTCGSCVLGETGGICPIARCAKGLLNGPCGGCFEGKCEVEFSGEKHDCAWYLIYNRLKDLGRLEDFTKFRQVKNWSLTTGPRKQVGMY